MKRASQKYCDQTTEDELAGADAVLQILVTLGRVLPPSRRCGAVRRGDTRDSQFDTNSAAALTYQPGAVSAEKSKGVHRAHARVPA